MKYHQPTIEADRITYKPYIDNLKEDYGAVVIGFLLIGVATLIHKDYREASAACIMIGILAIIIGLCRSIFLSRVTFIFDAKSRYMYKKQPWGSPRQAMAFDTVHSVITSSEFGSFHYCLTRKGNIFGSNTRISNDFRASKMRPRRQEFEEYILPAIVDMIGINGKSSVRIVEGHFHTGKINK